MKTVLGVLALILLLLAGCATPPEAQTPAQAAAADAPPQDALDERIAYYARV